MGSDQYSERDDTRAELLWKLAVKYYRLQGNSFGEAALKKRIEEILLDIARGEAKRRCGVSPEAVSAEISEGRGPLMEALRGQGVSDTVLEMFRGRARARQILAREMGVELSQIEEALRQREGEIYRRLVEGVRPDHVALLGRLQRGLEIYRTGEGKAYQRGNGPGRIPFRGK